MTEYAMYKGDRFIDLGTLTYLAEKYHRQKTLKFLAIHHQLIREVRAQAYYFTGLKIKEKQYE